MRDQVKFSIMNNSNEGSINNQPKQSSPILGLKSLDHRVIIDWSDSVLYQELPPNPKQPYPAKIQQIAVTVNTYIYRFLEFF